jgi:hypothetical protein
VGPNEGTYLNALRHDCRMSDVPGAPATPEIQPGVMSSLPKTRPQRPSARRASARQAAAATGGEAPAARPSRPKTARKKRPAVKPEPPRAPRQGFEVESEIETGKTVAPPNSVELAASVVELLGELAQSGIRSGERLLRDALTRRPSS